MSPESTITAIQQLLAELPDEDTRSNVLEAVLDRRCRKCLTLRASERAASGCCQPWSED
jgi:hypothetical protein